MLFYTCVCILYFVSRWAHIIEMCNINYCQALELDPHSESARVSMAYLLQSEGRFMDAWNTLTEGSARDQGEMNCRTIEFRVCFSCYDSCSWLGAKMIQHVTQHTVQNILIITLV